eukprot:TRINITY_DN6263_c0_g1_i1.p1 TRINITY_DN6263_c0_g1~~TRINITY_DN6263_c0_g1_i1.p1  ORF type:complete len:340 (+),score=60.48 TRINITY_DN6263_c0_g1_i1:1050-2069(+)
MRNSKATVSQESQESQESVLKAAFASAVSGAQTNMKPFPNTLGTTGFKEYSRISSETVENCVNSLDYAKAFSALIQELSELKKSNRGPDKAVSLQERVEETVTPAEEPPAKRRKIDESAMEDSMKPISLIGSTVFESAHDDERHGAAEKPLQAPSVADIRAERRTNNAGDIEAQDHTSSSQETASSGPAKKRKRRSDDSNHAPPATEQIQKVQSALLSLPIEDLNNALQAWADKVCSATGPFAFQTSNRGGSLAETVSRLLQSQASEVSLHPHLLNGVRKQDAQLVGQYFDANIINMLSIVAEELKKRDEMGFEDRITASDLKKILDSDAVLQPWTDGS